MANNVDIKELKNLLSPNELEPDITYYNLADFIGLNKQVNQNKLSANESPELSNVSFDDHKVLSKRNGQVNYITSASGDIGTKDVLDIHYFGKSL